MTWAGQASLPRPGSMWRTTSCRRSPSGSWVAHSHDHVVGPELAGDAPKDLVRGRGVVSGTTRGWTWHGWPCWLSAPPRSGPGHDRAPAVHRVLLLPLISWSANVAKDRSS